MDHFQKIVQIGRKYWFRLLLGISAMLLTGVVAVWPTWALKLVTDALAEGALSKAVLELQVIPQQLIDYGLSPWYLKLEPKKFLGVLPWFLLIGFVLDGFLRYINSYETRFYSVLVANDLREQAHEKITQLSYAQLKDRRSGDLVSVLTSDLTLLQSLLAEVLTCLIRDSALVLGLAVWLLAINWKLSLLGALILPPFIWLINKLFRRLRRLANRGQIVTGELSAYISESAQGADLIRLFNLQKQRHQAFIDRSKEFIKIWQKQLVVDAAINPILGVLSAIGIGFIGLSFGLNLVYEKIMTIGDFISYIIALILLYQPLKRLLRVNGQINQISGTCERVFALIDAQSDQSNSELESELEGAAIIRKGGAEPLLEFRSVDFHYDLTQPVLEDISLRIYRGERVALVGQSGGGKSTLSKLIPRLYEVTEGQILLQGKDIRDWDLRGLRDQISYIPQDSFLFSGTLRENLLLVKPDARLEEIEMALQRAKVDFLELLPLGLDSLVGERGSNLSGGQRQRIAIARAFLKDSPILILDEPTSSLDQKTEEMIKDSLFALMKDRTVLLVTHKLNLIRDFDRIVLIKEGRILEQGTHSELSKMKGNYLELVEALV
ncbi:MAG: ABC transporter ATP-binding protein [Candidatus Caenarcaniphilales bacterium]|nr:ABC transporter ATP-binding protein [Candidatus Caenarcaniphilales bacterium]